MAIETKKAIDIIKESLAQLEGEESFAFSIEHFPLADTGALQNIYNDWHKFAKNGAKFIDLAWGPAPLDVTAATTRDVNTVFGLEGQMHLTIAQQSAEDVKKALKTAKELGIRNIFALRGNPPQEPIESSLKNAVDLVKLIREEYGDYFGIGVGSYVEGHWSAIQKVPEDYKFSESELRRRTKVNGDWYVLPDAEFEKELQYLKQKVDAGADFVVTQFSFDAELFDILVKKIREAGIEVPIIPGLAPIQSFDWVKGQIAYAKTHIPQELQEIFEKHAENKDEFLKATAEFTGKQIKTLVKLGHRFLHFCTINNSAPTIAGLKNAGFDFKEDVEISEEEQAKIDAALAELGKLLPKKDE